MAVQKTNTNGWFIDLNQDLVLGGGIDDKEHRRDRAGSKRHHPSPSSPNENNSRLFI